MHEIAAHLDMSHGSAHHIVHDVLQYHKLSARSVPRQLTEELEERRVDARQEILKHSEADGGGFLGRTVTGDETWVHYHQPETKEESKERHHTSSPKLKKFRTRQSAGKVTLTLFLDERGLILEHYMPRGTLWPVQRMQISSRIWVRPAIKSKRRGLLSTGVSLQHDNAQPHTARSNVATIQDLSFKCLPHPPYSPDLAPSDLHVFGPLRGDGRQVFQVRPRGATGGARVAALSPKRLSSFDSLSYILNYVATNNTKSYPRFVMQYPFKNFQDLVKAMTIRNISSSRKCEEQFQFCCMKSLTIQNGLYHTILKSLATLTASLYLQILSQISMLSIPNKSVI